MEIESIVEKLSFEPKCSIFPRSGYPAISKNANLPIDLGRFYEVCGGADLFYGEPFGYRVLKPSDVHQGNQFLFGEMYESEQQSFDRGIAWSLYLIAHSSAGFVSIVLDEKSTYFGFCADSSGSIHGTCDSAIIAKSFTEFLTLAYEAKGQNILWDDLNPKYGYLGDL